MCESCMEICHKDCLQEPDRINVGAKVRYIGNAPYECNCNDLTDCQVSRKKSNSVKYLNSDEFRNAIISHSRNNSCRSKTSRSNSHSARRMSTVSATKQVQWKYVEEENYIFWIQNMHIYSVLNIKKVVELLLYLNIDFSNITNIVQLRINKCL